MFRRITFLIAIFTLIASSLPAQALHTLDKYVNSTALANPGLIVMDPESGKVIVENKAESLRVPASVLKLISTSAALHYLGPEKTFTTSIWKTSKSGVFLLRGNLDPWLTSNSTKAKKNKQRYLPSLVSKANISKKKSITLYYYGLYDKDLSDLKVLLRKQGIRATTKHISKEEADAQGKEKVASLTSEPITTMVSFAILWSDNALADRLGKAAARKIGNPTTPEGLTKTFVSALDDLGVDSKGLSVEDGSGLSKANRVSAMTLVSLLGKIRNDARFQSIYDGMPIAGLTGTLVNRFVETAPNAIGHVHAKTGWVNRSVTMAGYVDDGKHEYVFAILADGIQPTLKARKAARAAMDKFLGVIVQGSH